MGLTNKKAINKVIEEIIPDRPYCSNSLNTEGLYRLPKPEALTKRIIQLNPAAMLSCLVFDIDTQNGALAWERANLPAPNVAVINPANTHAHLIYVLDAPVCRTQFAKLKPLKYVAAIEYSMKLKMLADMAYAGLVCKNPFNPHWKTWVIHDHKYELGELAEYLPKLPSRLPKRAELTGLGRNVTLFEMGRKRSYALIKEYKPSGNYQAFERAVWGECELLNATLTPPLDSSEVKAIAKSIIKWTWKKFDLEAERERYRKYKAACGSKKGKSKREIGLFLLAKGESVEQVMQDTGASRATVFRWIARLETQA